MENLVVDGVYLHINNGGVSITVTNNDGLALEIKATHFGNLTNKMKLYVRSESLRNLGQMLIDASNQEGLKEIDYLGMELRGIDKVTGKSFCIDEQESQQQSLSGEEMTWDKTKWNDGTNFSNRT